MAGILKSLGNVEHGKPLGLFLRHAERPPITHWGEAFQLLLTEQGKEEARQLGRVLSTYGKIHLFHSPVQRCEQTAQAIAEGIRIEGGWEGRIESVSALGGPYILDTDKALEFAKNLGHAFIRTWFRGDLPKDTLLSRTETARIQWQSFVEKMATVGDDIAVLVSHDWNILTLREEYLHLQHEDVGWPKFLDGLAAFRHAQGFVLRYHDYPEVVIPSTHEPLYTEA